MSCPEVSALRHRFAADVAAGRLKLAERWGRPCLAYNLIIRPDAAARRSAGGVQELLLRREPALLAVPQEALHVSAAWLIPVHQDRHLPKDEFWELHGPSWLAPCRTCPSGCARSVFPCTTSWPRTSPSWRWRRHLLRSA